MRGRNHEGTEEAAERLDVASAEKMIEAIGVAFGVAYGGSAAEQAYWLAWCQACACSEAGDKTRSPALIAYCFERDRALIEANLSKRSEAAEVALEGEASTLLGYVYAWHEDEWCTQAYQATRDEAIAAARARWEQQTAQEEDDRLPYEFCCVTAEAHRVPLGGANFPWLAEQVVEGIGEHLYDELGEAAQHWRDSVGDADVFALEVKLRETVAEWARERGCDTDCVYRVDAVEAYPVEEASQ